MGELSSGLHIASYSIAGIAYLLLSVPLLTKSQGRLRAMLLTTVVIAAVFWAFVVAYGGTEKGLTEFQIFVAEMIHDIAWLSFLAFLMSGAIDSHYGRVLRYGGVVGGLALLAFGLAAEFAFRSEWQFGTTWNLTVLSSIGTSLYVLVIVEQIFRNARDSQRRSLKFLCLGVGGIFAYDLLMYSSATFTGSISGLLWSVRGVVVAMLLPLVAVAVHRSHTWSAGIFVSRKIVIYSATIFGAGVYLTLVGFGGYYVRALGGEWGDFAQVVFLVAALVSLLAFLISDSLRGRARVFVTKHFFENKYDYREEWLRLITTLTSDDDEIPLRKRAIKALAEIVHSPSGLLWLRSGDSGEFVAAAGWNVAEGSKAPIAATSFVNFVQATGWVIEISEYQVNPGRYTDLELDIHEFGVDEPAFIVPLLHSGVLRGFVVLAQPATASPLNFEDRDLMKTAGQQIASYLVQEISTEQLAESRQFEAYNKLTAYLMHDLKNLIAQQSLVVENSEKHKSNPKFVDDAIATIRGGVQRMRKVMEHLQQDPVKPQTERVELRKLTMRAVSQCADREPVPEFEQQGSPIWIRADRDRLLMALYHGIRNAQDATRTDGVVALNVDLENGNCIITIEDSGRGMDERFIREDLFRPFFSTKGTQGMGIGAYQIREVARSLGGEIEVSSRLGIGTRIKLILPVSA